MYICISWNKKNLGFSIAFESRRDEVLASVQKIHGDKTAVGRITSKATRKRYDALTEFHRILAISADIQCPWRPFMNVNATYRFGPSARNDETPNGLRKIRDHDMYMYVLSSRITIHPSKGIES